MTKRVCILPGGASHGSEVVGVLSELRPKYDVYIGTSTGALIAILAASGKYKELIDAYSTTTNREMYGILHPFTRKGKYSKLKLSLALINMFRANRLEMYNIGQALEKKVRRYFTPDDFDRLRKEKIEVVVTMKCIDKKGSRTEYISSLDPAMYYDKFVLACVASASIPYFAAPVSINGLRFVDGGVQDPIPTSLINTLYLNDEIDIFLMHSRRDLEWKYCQVDGPLEMAEHLLADQRNEIRKDDLLVIRNKKTRLVYATHKEESSASFEPELMKTWIQWGINRVREDDLTFEYLPT